MKNSFTIFFLSFITFSINAQNYQPLVVENATFVYEVIDEFSTNYEGYKITNDTVVNSVTYHKINSLMIEVDQISFLDYTLGPIIGYIREEDQKVYFKFELSTENYYLDVFIDLDTTFNCIQYSDIEAEVLLYDFTATIGDVVYPCTDINMDNIVVEDTTYLDIGGQSYFTYQTNVQPYSMIIGSKTDVLFYQEIFFTPYYSKCLIGYCVTEDLGCILGPLDAYNPEIIGNIFPNPFHDIITLQVPNPEKVDLLRIYDIQGQLIKQVNQFSQDMRIDLFDLDYSGLLTLLITDDRGEYQSSKICKR